MRGGTRSRHSQCHGPTDFWRPLCCSNSVCFTSSILLHSNYVNDPSSLRRDRSHSLWPRAPLDLPPSQVGGGPGHRGQQGQRTLEPLGWRLRLCSPSPIPRVGPNKPCVVCRESLPPGLAFCSAGFVSRSEVLEPFRPSWSQAVSHARRQKDTPPPEHGGAGAAKTPKSQRSQILGGEEVAWGL